MSKRKQQPETFSIEVSTFYDRLAWFVWMGREKEANGLRDLAMWFDPPLRRVDENRVAARVQQYIEDMKRLHDPSNWN